MSRLQNDYTSLPVQRYRDAIVAGRPTTALGQQVQKIVREWDGSLSKNPVTLREKLGGRWLTAEYRMGDLLTFGMATIHTGLDNHSDRIRLSSDSRYQLASEAVDERWIGANPISHGRAGKRGRIC